MHNFLRSIISSPLLAFVSVIVIWFLFKCLFIKICKLKPLVWILFEYFWIAVGFLGVMTIVVENKEEFTKQDIRLCEIWIERDYKSILYASSLQYHCVEFIHNAKMYTKNEFDSIQTRQDMICAWTNRVYSIVDSCYNNERPKLEDFPPLSIQAPEEYEAYDRILRLATNINENIDKKNDLQSTLKMTFWNEFKYGIGIILLIFAFGLRLTIVSYKLKNEKNKTVTKLE